MTQPRSTLVSLDTTPWRETRRDSHPAPPANRHPTRHQRKHPHRRHPLSDTTKVFNIEP